MSLIPSGHSKQLHLKRLAKPHQPPHDPGLHDAAFYLNSHTCVSLVKYMINIVCHPYGI